MVLTGSAVASTKAKAKPAAHASDATRFDWLVGDYSRTTPVPSLEGVQTPADALDDDIEAELQALHQARGTLAIVCRRARQRLAAPGFAPDRALQKRTLAQLDRWASALQAREARLGAEWRRRYPLPCRIGPWGRLRARVAGLCRRRPVPSIDNLA
ncbi:hypothetical protein pmac_cds_581 [Pandoravirus macleodensis]|uniref:Uncharacterized protein n=1 Tax=Pandoravirus macleodensis TaxID=2107707 RepID=A0A2U7UFK8_9VIRU|nr:hypothetical protein pmac_cds_581 [Pandoravirus macleodensis]AVK77269.1 hypothetical protein pmac_cds_581 [Pandoravirus macleodensis]UMO80008.1 hypothetical protein [Pandoravirus aubagnensis]